MSAPTIPECVHCGFCLPVCPTYDVLGTEMDNPRGRLYLMRGLEEGRISATEAVVRHLDLCLGCRACETECPSGVPYGFHLEKARATLHGSLVRPVSQRLLESMILWGVALPPSVQRAGAWLLRWAARGLSVVSASWIGRSVGGGRSESREAQTRANGRVPWDREDPPTGPAAPGTLTSPPRGVLAGAVSLLAALPQRAASLPRVTKARAPRKLRVGFLEGCVNRWVFGHVNQAAARLLSASGCEIVAPRGQRCCGALHAHAGDLAGARRLAQRNIAAFEAAGGLDAIVVTAAGCGSAMKEYAGLFEGDPEWHPRAHRFASKVRDALELMAETGVPQAARELPEKVAYHDACHLAHAQRIRAQPRALLAGIPKIELVPLADADRCCGSAGIYNVLHPEVASQILASKLARIRASGATIVTAANPGCLLQIAAGARAAGLSIRVAHPIELLDDVAGST